MTHKRITIQKEDVRTGRGTARRVFVVHKLVLSNQCQEAQMNCSSYCFKGKHVLEVKQLGGREWLTDSRGSLNILAWKGKGIRQIRRQGGVAILETSGLPRLVALR